VEVVDVQLGIELGNMDLRNTNLRNLRRTKRVINSGIFWRYAELHRPKL
jgi:hypothetical protein